MAEFNTKWLPGMTWSPGEFFCSVQKFRAPRLEPSGSNFVPKCHRVADLNLRVHLEPIINHKSKVHRPRAVTIIVSKHAAEQSDTFSFTFRAISRSTKSTGSFYVSACLAHDAPEASAYCRHVKPGFFGAGNLCIVCNRTPRKSACSGMAVDRALVLVWVKPATMCCTTQAPLAVPNALFAAISMRRL